MTFHPETTTGAEAVLVRLSHAVTLTGTVRSRDRDVQHSATARSSVQRFDGAIGFGIISHTDISEILAAGQINSDDLSVRLE